jgi:hypothetical protein
MNVLGDIKRLHSEIKSLQIEFNIAQEVVKVEEVSNQNNGNCIEDSIATIVAGS